jgi:hypothetical protein
VGGVPNAIPERTGVPAYGYPYPWSVVPYLPGAPAADADPPVWLHGDLHPATDLAVA